MNNKVVVWKDGSYLFTDVSWEYENDNDWLVTINLDTPGEEKNHD